MSPILNLQMTMRQLGRIRMGEQVPTKTGGKRPGKLETWRLTSPFRDSLEVAAEIYGGTVNEWTGAPSGIQWELYTDAASLDIMIPPGDMAFSQWMELWSGGGCMRRCDQEIEQLSGEACQCPKEPGDRMELAAVGKACKPTTRLSVIQPHLPDIGLWRLETHGWYGAIELAGTMEILRSIQTGMVPGKLTIDQRQVKRDGKTNNFAVPVIELSTLTAHTLMTGEIPASVQTPTVAAITAAREEVMAAPVAIEAPKPTKRAAAPRQTASKPAATGGTAFSRAITARALRAGMDQATLDALCVQLAGVPCGQVSDGTVANQILDAIASSADDGRAF